MSKILSIIFFFLSFSFILATPASAKIMFQKEGTLTIPASETLDDDLFLVGENLVLDGNVHGSVFVGAGAALISGRIDGDLVLGAGDAEITGIINGNVYLGAGNARLNKATILGTVIAGVGNFTIDKTSQIGGSLVVGAGNLKNYAPIGHSLLVGAGSLYLDSVVEKEVRFGGKDLTLGPNAKIEGDLTYTLGEAKGQFAKDPESKINGSISKYVPPKEAEDQLHRLKANATKTATGARGGWMFLSFIGSLLFGLLFLKFFPKTSLLLANIITKQATATIGTGFLLSIVTVPALIFLAITLIGFHLASFLFLVFCLSLQLSTVISVFALGRFLSTHFQWDKLGIYATFTLGFVAISLAKSLPIIGWIISIVATSAGLGSLWIFTRSHQKSL